MKDFTFEDIFSIVVSFFFFVKSNLLSFPLFFMHSRIFESISVGGAGYTLKEAESELRQLAESGALPEGITPQMLGPNGIPEPYTDKEVRFDFIFLFF